MGSTACVGSTASTGEVPSRLRGGLKSPGGCAGAGGAGLAACAAPSPASPPRRTERVMICCVIWGISCICGSSPCGAALADAALGEGPGLTGQSELAEAEERAAAGAPPAEPL
eukprot:2235080-Pyramimonas_sp.AAC.1